MENESEGIFFTSIGRVIPPNTDRVAVTAKFYLDKGADINMVNQNFAFEYDFITVEILLFKLEWMDYGTIYCFGMYLLVYEMKIIGMRKTDINTFFMPLIKNASVIFGNPTL